jgi:pimeloyl-ACP methyl ester carboxylesterase
MNQYREVWNLGLTGGCNYYRASPLRPATTQDPGAKAITLPPEMLRIQVRTLVIWGLLDTALRPVLLEGLNAFIPQLTLETWPDASHWLVHEHPERLIQRLTAFMSS